jgi:hypothetical protein
VPATEAAPEEDGRGTLVFIGTVVIGIASGSGAHYAGWAMGLSREHVQALELVVPATLLGAFEVWATAPKRVESDANPRGEDRFVAMGRGALIGASLAVFTDAIWQRGLPALGRLLEAGDASRGEAGDLWWALIFAFVLASLARRALPWAAQRYREWRSGMVTASTDARRPSPFRSSVRR